MVAWVMTNYLLADSEVGMWSWWGMHSGQGQQLIEHLQSIGQ